MCSVVTVHEIGVHFECEKASKAQRASFSPPSFAPCPALCQNVETCSAQRPLPEEPALTFCAKLPCPGDQAREVTAGGKVANAPPGGPMSQSGGIGVLVIDQHQRCL